MGETLLRQPAPRPPLRELLPKPPWRSATRCCGLAGRLSLPLTPRLPPPEANEMKLFITASEQSLLLNPRPLSQTRPPGLPGRSGTPFSSGSSSRNSRSSADSNSSTSNSRSRSY